ncbi:MAG: hypothetical protein IIB57_08925 [Planctomycetes bacterium]|nr:hypothetical protein [Planctomycetota bacterium]
MIRERSDAGPLDVWTVIRTWGSIYLAMIAAASKGTWTDGDEEPARCLSGRYAAEIGTKRDAAVRYDALECGVAERLRTGGCTNVEKGRPKADLLRLRPFRLPGEHDAEHRRADSGAAGSRGGQASSCSLRCPSSAPPNQQVPPNRPDAARQPGYGAETPFPIVSGPQADQRGPIRVFCRLRGQRVVRTAAIRNAVPGLMGGDG